MLQNKLDKTITYDTDSRGNVTVMTLPATGKITINYNQWNMITTISRELGVKDTYVVRGTGSLTLYK